MDNWVLHELKEHQITHHLETCPLLSQQNTKSFLHSIVTCDKKWILFNNCKCSARWLDKDEIPKYTPKLEFHQKKLMVLVWWSSAGVIHYSFMRPGMAITANVYINQLHKMMRKFAHKQPRLVNRDQPILLQDNALNLMCTKNVTQNMAMELKSIVKWLKCQARDQHDLGFWEWRFTALSPAWWSWQAFLNYSHIY